MAAQAKQQEPKSSLFASPQRARGLFPVAVELMIWKKKLGWQSTVVAGDLNLGERGHFFLCLKASSIEYCSVVLNKNLSLCVKLAMFVLQTQKHFVVDRREKKVTLSTLAGHKTICLHMDFPREERRARGPPRRIRLSSNQNGLQPWHVFSCEIVHPQYPLDKPTAQKKQSLQVNKDL